jgi:hypothetical protein
MQPRRTCSIAFLLSSSAPTVTSAGHAGDAIRERETGASEAVRPEDDLGFAGEVAIVTPIPASAVAGRRRASRTSVIEPVTPPCLVQQRHPPRVEIPW